MFFGGDARVVDFPRLNQKVIRRLAFVSAILLRFCIACANCADLGKLGDRDELLRQHRQFPWVYSLGIRRGPYLCSVFAALAALSSEA